MDRLFFTAVIINADGEKSLDHSTLYPLEEQADKFVAAWNGNAESVARYGKAETMLVRITECADYLAHSPLI